MTTIELGDLTVRDIGREVSITRQGASIVGPVVDFRVETDWITEQQMSQHPDDAERVPGKRTMTLTVGPWTTAALPLDTIVQVDR